MPWSIKLSALIACVGALHAGPVEFGLAEFDAAASAKKLNWKVNTNLTVDPPETFLIEPYPAGGARVSGGDLRGLMYGLLEAAAQIRATGKLTAAHNGPAAKLRAVRIALDAADLTKSWFASDLFWRAYFQTLARSRLNRLELAAPRLDSLPAIARRLAPIAAEYGVDFIAGLPPLSGDAGQIRVALSTALSAAPVLRGLELEAEGASADLYRAALLPALRQAGRRVTLDLHGGANRLELVQAAIDAGVPLQVSGDVPCDDHLLHLTESFCGAGYGFDYTLRVRAPVPSQPADVRVVLASLSASGGAGFELDIPASHLGGEAGAWAFESHSEFYRTWGALGYDPRR